MGKVRLAHRASLSILIRSVIGLLCISYAICIHQNQVQSILKRSASVVLPAVLAWNVNPENVAHAATTAFDSSFTASLHIMKKPKISYGLEGARQKRTAALKSMQEKGIIKIDTDDSGNQFLSLPWIPDKKLPYKSLSVKQRLINEVSAGAFGEISKDVMLHWVDTLKTRRQAQPSTPLANTTTLIQTPALVDNSSPIQLSVSPLSALENFKTLYAGFPIVALASIPQGGLFFLVKKGMVELQTVYYPQCPELLSATLPICLGVMAYWVFRTPAEVIKTQVQTRQQPDVKTAFDEAKSKGIASLWKYYTVMLSLDIPFQIVNFILFGIVTDAVTVQLGLPANSILTRLLCGVSCGMFSAAVTCPLDVCKTRIISRDKKLQQQQQQQQQQQAAAEQSVLIIPQSAEEQRSYFLLNDTKASAEYYTADNAAYSTANNANMQSDSSVVQLIERPVLTQNAMTQSSTNHAAEIPVEATPVISANRKMIVELATIFKEEGLGTLFLGFKQRLLYTGLANGIRLTAYGTSRMDLMMRSLDDL